MWGKLFEIQGGLDYRILEKFGLQSKDVLLERLLAFMIENGETGNDWRGFKFWSENKQPKETLLEEFVDGLHFILSIGITLHEMSFIRRLPDVVNAVGQESITKQFLDVYAAAVRLYEAIESNGLVAYWYRQLFEAYLGLGGMLGFNLEQIESAYLEKNAENHDRQERGY